MHIMYSHLASEVRVVMNDNSELPVPYEIIDADGRIVRKGKLPVNSKTHNISMNGMPEGTYEFRIQSQSISFQKRKIFS